MLHEGKVSRKKIVCILFFIITLLISGFRWDVGIDWMSYYQSFGGNILDNDTLSESMEPFNLVTCALLQSFGFHDGRYWIWCMALINLLFLSISIYKYSSHVIISIFLYFLLGFFFDSLNMIRQACAVSIVLYSWQFINNNFPRFIITIGLACLFHTSALLMLPIYYIKKISIDKNKLKYLLIISIFIAPISTILAPKLILALPFYQQYSDSSVIKYASGNGNLLSYIRMIFPLFIMYITIHKWRHIQNSRENVIAINTVIGLLLNIAFPTTQLIIRMASYFNIGLIFYLPFLIKLYKGLNRKILWGLSIIYYFLSLSINYLFSPVAKIMPFTFRFDLDFVRLSLLSFILIIIILIINILLRKKCYNINYNI